MLMYRHLFALSQSLLPLPQRWVLPKATLKKASKKTTNPSWLIQRFRGLPAVLINGKFLCKLAGLNEVHVWLPENQFIDGGDENKPTWHVYLEPDWGRQELPGQPVDILVGWITSPCLPQIHLILVQKMPSTWRKIDIRTNLNSRVIPPCTVNLITDFPFVPMVNDVSPLLQNCGYYRNATCTI